MIKLRGEKREVLEGPSRNGTTINILHIQRRSRDDIQNTLGKYWMWKESIYVVITSNTLRSERGKDDKRKEIMQNRYRGQSFFL